jgi:hypothetical protein
VEAFDDRSFWAGNPFPHTAQLHVHAVLPPLLASPAMATRNRAASSLKSISIDRALRGA